MSRVVALDVGDARVGVAASDEMGITANPVATITRGRSVKADIRAVEELLGELEASLVVVGLPLTAESEEGPQARKVREFAERLTRRIRIPVEMWDERFSTLEAQEALVEQDVSRAARREVIDKMAAAVILESYLRERGGS